MTWEVPRKGHQLARNMSLAVLQPLLAVGSALPLQQGEFYTKLLVPAWKLLLYLKVSF